MALSNPPNIIKLDYALVVCGTAFILVAVMQFLPSLASSLLTGSPALNAGAAMSAAIGARAALVTNAYHTGRMSGKAGKEFLGTTLKRAEQGATKGIQVGSKLGLAGAVTGAFVGGLSGGLEGSIEGGLKGGYSAAKYGLNQGLLRKPEYDTKKKKSKGDGNNQKNPKSIINPSKAESKNSQKVNTGSGRAEDTNATDLLRELQREQSSNNANTGTQPIVNGEQGVPSWMQ